MKGFLQRVTLLSAILAPAILSSALAEPIISSQLIDLVAGQTPTEKSKEEGICCATAYVRAPDLRPGMTTTVDARIFLNGTACDRFEKWEVGLRLKEWAIFRFSAPNVTLPTKPEWTPEFDARPEAEEAIDDDDLSGLFNQGYGGSWGNGRQTAFQKAMQVYEKAMTNKSLWHFQGVEREVFDSRIELDMMQDESTIKNETTYIAVRQFVVEVPDTNFPPQSENDNPYYGGYEFEDSSRSETLFEYYFLLTLRNGSTIDVPAGKTAFIPANTEGPMTTLTDQVKRAPEGGKTSSVIMEEVDMFTAGPRFGTSSGEPPAQNDQTSNFTVELSIPSNPTFQAGRNFTIQARVIKTGNSTDVPYALALSLGTCTIDAWAKSHATTANHTRVSDRCAYPRESHWLSLWSSSRVLQGDMLRQRRDLKDLCLHPMEWTQDEEENQRRGGGVRMTISSHGYPWDEIEEGATLLEDRGGGGVTNVNLTIPWDVVPAFNRTFQQYKHLLTVLLITASDCPSCEEDEQRADEAADRVVSDLETDLNWSAYPAGEMIWTMPRRKNNEKKRVFARHKGTTQVKLLASQVGRQSTAVNPGMAQGRIRHYSDPRAAAIRLVGKDSTANGITKYVNTTWKTDLKLSELTFNRYNAFSRRDAWCGGSSMSYAQGTASSLVSDVWARKACPEYRKNWYAARKNKKGKKEIDSSAPVGQVTGKPSVLESGNGQVQLQL